MAVRPYLSAIVQPDNCKLMATYLKITNSIDSFQIQRIYILSSF
jgi:hypothetical protein